MTGNSRDLRGKHALVTGATTHLARVLAVGLAEAGANVSVTTTTPVLAEEVQANSILNECWAAAGVSGQALTLDLTDPAAVEAAINALEQEIVPIDILVNATQAAGLVATLDASVEDFRAQLDRHTTTTFVACQAVGRRMTERGPSGGTGRVVNLVSLASDQVTAGAALFSASQAAILGLTRALATEWPAVSVNALGIEFYDGGALSAASAAAVQEVVVTLASDDAREMHGELLTVDGSLADRAE